jgi:hypothetical protein
MTPQTPQWKGFVMTDTPARQALPWVRGTAPVDADSAAADPALWGEDEDEEAVDSRGMPAVEPVHDTTVKPPQIPPGPRWPTADRAARLPRTRRGAAARCGWHPEGRARHPGRRRRGGLHPPTCPAMTHPLRPAPPSTDRWSRSAHRPSRTLTTGDRRRLRPPRATAVKSGGKCCSGPRSDHPPRGGAGPCTGGAGGR